MLQKLLVIVALIFAFRPFANAKISIENCEVSITQQSIAEAVRFLAKNVDEIRTEKYSYVRERVNMELNIDDQVPIYIADADRYRIDLTDDEVNRLHSVLFDQDITIRCAGPLEELYCKISEAGAYASRTKPTVTLCKSAYEASSGLGCFFYGVIAHELFHLADFPISSQHNHTETLRFKDDDHAQLARLDKVFKGEKAIANLCHHQTYDYKKTTIEGVDYFIAQ